MKSLCTASVIAATCILVGCAATKEYSFPDDAGGTSFSLSKRWHPSSDSPKRFDPKSLTYEFTPDGPRYVPTLYITEHLRTRTSQDSYAEQHDLAEKSLRELRSTNWKNGGLAVIDTYERADEVDILKWAEVSNGIHIVAYVPRRDCVIEINYSGQFKNLARYEDDINALIESIPLD